MTTILLIRHAVNDYVDAGKLAGWLPGVHLNDAGKAQAEVLGQRLAKAPIRHLYSSPLERALETAQAIQRHHQHLEIMENDQVGEVRYGDWDGMALDVLRKRKMWKVIQDYPSRASFPNGETMRAAQTRAVNEIECLVKNHPGDLVAVVSHAGIIKMVFAHYLGMHLDNFQRIVVLPASISTLTVGYGRPYIVTINDVAHILQLKQDQKNATPILNL